MDGKQSFHITTMIKINLRCLFHGENGFEGSESYEYNENGTLKLAKWDISILGLRENYF